MKRCVLVILCVLLPFERAVVAESRPNIVFILADDLGFNDIGYHARNHHSDIQTPFLDELAADGVKLENYYVQRICSPTRAQLLTGRYAIKTGMQLGVIRPGRPKGLPLNNRILPEQLRRCGYDTIMVGKWHLGQHRSEFLPHRRGFNTYSGLLSGSANYFTRERCYRKMCGVDWFTSRSGPNNDTWGEYSAHLFARKSVEAIDDRDRSKPFFLYLSYQSPHAPIQAPTEYMKPFRHIKSRRRRTYAGMVLAMDESIRNVTQHLKHSGLLDNTIIVFSTDNGGAYGSGGNNWPLRGQKRTLWEGGVRAVGFAYGKPLAVSGVTHRGLFDVADWFPTFLRVAECPVSSNTQPLDGIDQWDALRQNGPSPRTEILHFIARQRISAKKKARSTGFNVKTSAALRFGPWKMITGSPWDGKWVPPPESVDYIDQGPRPSGKVYNESIRLYNIEQDPYEIDNIADKKPDVVRYMLKRLEMYASAAVYPENPRLDLNADPNFHKGYWVPWMDETMPNMSKKKSSLS